MCQKLTVTSGNTQTFTKRCKNRNACVPGKQGQNREVECCDGFLCNAPATTIETGVVHQPFTKGNSMFNIIISMDVLHKMKIYSTATSIGFEDFVFIQSVLVYIKVDNSVCYIQLLITYTTNYLQIFMHNTILIYFRWSEVQRCNENKIRTGIQRSVWWLGWFRNCSIPDFVRNMGMISDDSS